nr:hypothetical protein [Filomicrobium insigne]
MSGNAFVAIANRAAEHPIAVHEPGAHAVLHLLGVLLALVLGDGGQKIFDKHAVGILAEFYGGAFKLTTCLPDGGAQFDMRLEPARKTADIIDDDAEAACILVLAKKGQHGLHAGPVDHPPGYALIPEYLHDVVALVPRILPAARFLRSKAIALLKLAHAGYAAIDDGWGHG